MTHFRMDELMAKLADGLDVVEQERRGVTPRHAKRVALLAVLMGRYLHWKEEELVGLGTCALLHDNALAECFQEDKPNLYHVRDQRNHCVRGERNVAGWPFPKDVTGFILHHHEHMDGTGAFGIDPAEMPVGAQLIAVANATDVMCDLRARRTTGFRHMVAFVKAGRGTRFSPAAADAMLPILDDDLVTRMRDENLDATLREVMPRWEVEFSDPALMHAIKAMARIIDLKSAYTRQHTTQIANRAYLMARQFGYDEVECTKVYFAAGLHDIGKLLVPQAVLDKAGELSAQELTAVKRHAALTHQLLKDVDGLGEVERWAACHHRRVDGTGYPDNLPEEYFPLDFTSRLLTCTDVYQAVREVRPYHAYRTHQEAMEIMRVMAGTEQIDWQITDALGRQMAWFEIVNGDVPDPEDMDRILELI